GEQRMGQESYRFPTTALNGVKVHQPLRAFYLVAGFMGLATFSFFGGHLLLAAARGGELVLASLGGGVIGLAYLFDSAMHALHERARGKLIVELYCQQMKQPLALAIDRQNGSALIDTLLTWGAEQREHRFNQDWSELVSTSLEESEEEEEEA
ncbi:MAG: hypothetical protein VYD19_07575, partial [Myxococcota bacterium]|nr:hypothetical protein [Myxococcota bacterium]